MVDYDCDVVCGDILVHPGDLIFADCDGVCVIPKEIAEKVVLMAVDKVEKEDNTRRELLEGKLLRDVYEKYGVL